MTTTKEQELKDDDNSRTLSKCPNCRKFVKHASRFAKNTPKYYRTYYCADCKALFYSDFYIEELKQKIKGDD